MAQNDALARTQEPLILLVDSRLVDAGSIDHCNASSGIGSWPYGQFLLGQLVDEAGPPRQPLFSNRFVATLELEGLAAGGFAR